MRIDDIHWALNKSTGMYEIYLYEATGGSSRLVNIEMPPMALYDLARKLAASIETAFPPVQPPVTIAAEESDSEKQGQGTELSERKKE